MTINPNDPLNCACFNVRRAARRITQVYDQALRPAGLQATQFSLLAVLDGTGGKTGVGMTALARSLGMDRTTLTRNLTLVERKNWVEVVPGKDRRERVVRITPEGKKTLSSGVRYWRKAQENLVSLLGEKGFSTLLNVTRRVDVD